MLQYDSSGTSVPFTLQLEVHDEQGKLASEEQDISLKQLEKWIVLLDTERNGKDVCTSPKLDGDGFIIGKSREKKRSGHEVFATPQFGQRYLHCSFNMLSADRCVAGWRSPHPRAQ